MAIPQLSRLPAPSSRQTSGRLPVPSKAATTSIPRASGLKQADITNQMKTQKHGDMGKKRAVAGKGNSVTCPRPFVVPGARLPPRKFPAPAITKPTQAGPSKLPGPSSSLRRPTAHHAVANKTALHRPALQRPKQQSQPAAQVLVSSAKHHTELLPVIEKLPKGPIASPEREIFNAIYRIYLMRVLERDGRRRRELDERLGYFRGRYPQYFVFLCECNQCPWSKDEKTFGRYASVSS